MRRAWGARAFTASVHVTLQCYKIIECNLPTYQVNLKILVSACIFPHVSRRMQRTEPGYAMVDVAVVGGSAWFVGALKSVLAATQRFSLSATTANVLGVLAEIRTGDPCIVIIACGASADDVQMLIRRCRRRNRDVRVVVKFHALRPNLVRDAMQAGAWGCFSTDDSPETVLNMLTSVAEGRTSFPFVDFSLLRDDPFEQLTRREREVLDALSQGWSNTQISSRLGISENTVKYHLKLIYGKLGVANRSTAISHYMQRAIAWNHFAAISVHDT